MSHHGATVALTEAEDHTGRGRAMGERSGFDAFVAARSGRLLGTAYLLTRDADLAEDLLQTALTKAWFAWSRIEGEPEPYVRKVLVNTYASWWRRRWNGEQPTEELPEARYAGHADPATDKHDLWVALGRLPRRQRAVVVLRYFEDLSEAETARILDCSVGTVKSQASKALAKLRIDPALVAETRSRLHDYAAAVADDGPHPRVVAVRGRVQAVRRRRRATGIAGLAAALVAAAAVAVPTLVGHHEPQPAGPAPSTLAGRVVPRTQTAVGYTYDYVRGVQSKPGQRALRLTVPVGKTPELVMWASSDTTEKPVMRLATNVDSDGPELSPAGDFDRYAFLGTSQRVRLTQRTAGPHTRLALAVYQQSPTPPPGVSNHVITFRRQILDDRLLTARIGRPGQAALDVPVRIPRGPLRWSDTCYGSNLWYSVAVNGHEILASTCGGEPVTDAGVDGATFDGNPLAEYGIRAGDTAHVRVWLHQRGGGRKVAADPDVVLGFGLYKDAARTTLVAGQRIPDASEDAGHEYIAADWHESQPGSRVLRVRLAPSDRVRSITGVVTHAALDKGTVWHLGLVGERDGVSTGRHESFGGGGSGYATDAVVQPGESPTVVLRLDQGVTPRTRLGIVVSNLVH